MSYHGESIIKRIATQAPLVVSGASMQPIPEWEVQLEEGRYRATLTPHYDVSDSTAGTGWNFQGGTAVLANYSFRALLSNTATAIYARNYNSRNQNFTTPRTSRMTNNRATIIGEFLVTSPGSLIPHFRARLAGQSVTLLPGALLELERIE